MKTGIELIAKEREEQLGKHNFDKEWDSLHVDGELLDFAVSIIEQDVDKYPWNPTLFVHIKRKDRIEQLSIAGALIAAEIDRLNNNE